MKIETINASVLKRQSRLDSKFFLADGARALRQIASAKVAGLRFIPLGGPDGIANIWQPNRFGKIEAATKEESVGYLRPYDIFEYLPSAADRLSVARSAGIDKCRLRPGMLLQTCSGRNLGPAAFVDEYLARFVVGSDMIRIEIDDPHDRIYTLAYLQSEVGQHVLTQGKTGSVIDHLSPQYLSTVEIPQFDHEVKRGIVTKMMEAIQRRENARLTLENALVEFEGTLPLLSRSEPEKRGWTVQARTFTGRLDAVSYDPLVADVKKSLLSNGGISVAEVARVLKPAQRYKTVYVGRGHGSPILSGGQLLQVRPINLRYMPEQAFGNPEIYKLQSTWIAYQADGRVEDALGIPVMVTSDRSGWLASGHVGRVIGNKDVDRGWLYLALRSWTSQIQIKSLASGSVVDSTFPVDMESVILPRPCRSSTNIIDAWENFAIAQKLENEAIHTINVLMSSL